MRAAILAWVLLAGAPAPAQQPVPLTDEERRELLLRLDELKAARAEIALYKNFLAEIDANVKDFEQSARRAIELEKRATSLAVREKEIVERERDFYRAALEKATKKRSRWCTLAKILTLGIARCP